MSDFVAPWTAPGTTDVALGAAKTTPPLKSRQDLEREKTVLALSLAYLTVYAGQKVAEQEAAILDKMFTYLGDPSREEIIGQGFRHQHLVKGKLLAENLMGKITHISKCLHFVEHEGDFCNELSCTNYLAAKTRSWYTSAYELLRDQLQDQEKAFVCDEHRLKLKDEEIKRLRRKISTIKRLTAKYLVSKTRASAERRHSRAELKERLQLDPLNRLTSKKTQRYLRSATRRMRQ